MRLKLQNIGIIESADINVDGITLIANIIMQQGNNTIVSIQDARPIIGFRATGVSATATHGNLLGLSNDDHQQYLLVNGSISIENLTQYANMVLRSKKEVLQLLVTKEMNL